MNKDMNSLRNTLGVLGFLLPILTLFFNLVFGRAYNPVGVLSSISATHYSAGYLLFEGLVFSTGLFLICYQGYDIRDRVATVLAGSGAIALTLFPCALDGAETKNFLMLPQHITNVIHLGSAGLFFGSLVYLIGFQFTRTSEGCVVSPKTRKWRRNILYRTCAIIMLAALIIGFGGKAVFVSWKYSVFSGEWVALWAFSLAYLTKGGLILPDL